MKKSIPIQIIDLPYTQIFIESNWSKFIPFKYLIPTQFIKLNEQSINFLIDDCTNLDYQTFKEKYIIQSIIKEKLKGNAFVKICGRTAKDVAYTMLKVLGIQDFTMLFKMSQFLTQAISEEIQSLKQDFQQHKTQQQSLKKQKQSLKKQKQSLKKQKQSLKKQKQSLKIQKLSLTIQKLSLKTQEQSQQPINQQSQLNEALLQFSLRQYKDYLQEATRQFRIYTINGSLVGVCQKVSNFISTQPTYQQIKKAQQISNIISKYIQTLLQVQKSPIEYQIVIDCFILQSGKKLKLLSIEPLQPLNCLSLFSIKQLKQHYLNMVIDRQIKPLIKWVETQEQYKEVDLDQYRLGAQLGDKDALDQWKQFIKGK